MLTSIEWLHMTSPGAKLCPVKQSTIYDSDPVHSSSERKSGPVPGGYDPRGNT